eukprot:CAMPEP_0194686568 /NCGR_PEP_ID=MMETSP0295-20121207/15591_1 /TAXON_ID=39354 /ORGANISM="Heterosigma akashiwo, Strain CCMP2393" /LENGTH=59 /DNA_ID=CAMNT_0039574439 /DNA_START=128 /DNA_END=303 /DNA_ORIENTATION=+
MPENGSPSKVYDQCYKLPEIYLSATISQAAMLDDTGGVFAARGYTMWYCCSSHGWMDAG